MAARTVITFGTFDLFHYGHVRLLERARALGERLVVGVSTDALTAAKKGRPPVFGERERLAIVAALRVVDAVFSEETLEQKAGYIRREAADVLVMGDDWTGRFDDLAGLCRVVYLPRTPGVSTSRIRDGLRDAASANRAGE